jgi:hypothetical protein
MTTANEPRDYSNVDLSNGVNRGRLRHAARRGDRQAKVALDKWLQLQAPEKPQSPQRVSAVNAARDAYLARHGRNRRSSVPPDDAA